MSQIDVFVVGLNEANMRTLNDVPDAVQYHFHGVLTVEEVQHGDIPIAELTEKAEKELDAFDGEIGAIVGYWDFPVSTLVPILCRRYGLPSADLEAIVKCEHKYWSRLEQQKVIDEHPRFAIVNLSNPETPPNLDYPMCRMSARRSTRSPATGSRSRRSRSPRRCGPSSRHCRSGSSPESGRPTTRPRSAV